MFSAALVSSLSLYSQKDSGDDFYLLIKDPHYNAFGYINRKGDTVIPYFKYSKCYTDTFRTIAIVLKQGMGYIAIDKKEVFLFRVFPYNNQPDSPSEGLFRIIENGKTGYADKEGRVVITPKFDCAFPFKGGLAKVGEQSRDMNKAGIYDSRFIWYYIDKKGHRVKEEKESRNEPY